MKQLCLTLMFMSLPLTSLLHGNPASPMDTYLLGPGDQLSIEIVTRDDLSTQQIIAPDGSVYLPLLERRVVAGQSLATFQRQLKTDYKAYLKTPILNVTLTPRPIYVVQHDLKTELFTVQQASSLSEASSYGGGQLDSTNIQHGGVYHVNVGRAPTFWEKNWYKIVTTVAIVAGVLGNVAN